MGANLAIIYSFVININRMLPKLYATKATTKVRFIVISLLVAIWALSACSSAPVQEMSDARQAIQAAKNAVTNEQAQQNIKQAEMHLEEAKRALEKGEYNEARINANTAKALAVEVQEQAGGDASSY